MKTVGIIGFGVFGRFMAEQLSPHLSVQVSSRSAKAADVTAAGAQLVPLETAAKANFVMPSVPVQNLETVLERLAPLLGEDSVVVDVSSVKVRPVAMMEQLLPANTGILATHPLFGPQSGAGGIEGLPMVVWPVRLPNEVHDEITGFLGNVLKLNVIKMSPDEHDKEMAYVQALTFLLGRAFSEIDIPDTPLKTKTYQHLLDVRRVVESDTPDVFDTIQQFNPYADVMRRRFVGHLDSIESQLRDQK